LNSVLGIVRLGLSAKLRARKKPKTEAKE
jgi:hypothetical protein